MRVGEGERVEGVAADGLDGLVLCVAEDALGVHAPELADGVDAVALVADHGHGAVVLCDDYCGALVSLLLRELYGECCLGVGCVWDLCGSANIIVSASHAINTDINGATNIITGTTRYSIYIAVAVTTIIDVAIHTIRTDTVDI